MRTVSGPITQNTTNLITVLLLPVAILMIAYALATFYARSVYLQRKQVLPCSPPSACNSKGVRCNVWLHDARGTAQPAVVHLVSCAWGQAFWLTIALCCCADGLLPRLDRSHSHLCACHDCTADHHNCCILGCDGLLINAAAIRQGVLRLLL